MFCLQLEKQELEAERALGSLPLSQLFFTAHLAIYLFYTAGVMGDPIFVLHCVESVELMIFLSTFTG